MGTKPKITYTLRNPEGKTVQIDQDEFDKYQDDYIRDNEDVSIRMRGEDGDYFVPLGDYKNAMADGYHAFTFKHGYERPQPPKSTTTATPLTKDEDKHVEAPVQEQVEQKPQTKDNPLSDAERNAMLSGTTMMGMGALSKNNAAIANIGRMQQRNTVKGRQQQRANEAAVRTMGGKVQTNEIAAPLNNAAQQEGVSLPSKDSTPSTQSPQAVGVVYDKEGKPQTQWLMPDGSITTDQNAADVAGIAARGARLAQSFNDRMHENGLDPKKADDVQQQQWLDVLDAVDKTSDSQKTIAGLIDGKADESAEVAQKAFDERFKEIGDAQKGNAPFNDKLDRMAQGAVQTKEANREYVKALQDYADAQTKSIEAKLRDPKTQASLIENARNMGISPDLYLKAIGSKAVEQMQEQMQRKQIDRYMPKSDSEYIVRGFEHSIAGLIQRALYETGEQAAYRDQATAEYGEQAGTGAQLANMGVGFVADAPFFGVSGKLSGAAIKAIAERQIGKMVANGMTREAATRAIETAASNSFGKEAMKKIGQGVLGGAVNLGSFNAMSETARQVANEEYAPGQIATEAGKGMATGGALGLAGGLVGRATADLSGMAKFGGKVAGFGTEAAVFATADRIMGEDTGRSWTEDLAQSAMQLAVMKATSPGAWGRFAGKGLGAMTAIFHGEGKKYVSDMARDAMRSTNDKRGVFQFSPEAQEDLKKSRAAQNLMEALTGMESEGHMRRVEEGKAKAERGEDFLPVYDSEGNEIKPEQKFSDAQKSAQQAYADVMRDSEVTYDTKVELARYMGDTMEYARPDVMAYDTNEENGKYTVTTRDADGNAISRETFDDETTFNARLEQLQGEARENYDRRKGNEEALRSIIGEIVDEGSASEEEITSFLKNRTTGDDTRDAQLSAIIKHKAEEVQRRNEYYQEQKQKQQQYADEGKAAYQLEEQRLLEGPRQQPVDEDGQPVETEAQPNTVDLLAERVKLAREQLDETFSDMSEEIVSSLDADPWKTFDDYKYTNEQAQVMVDYINAKAALDGALEAANESTEGKKAEIEGTIRKQTHQKSGMIQPVTLKDVATDGDGNELRDAMGNAVHQEAYLVYGDVKLNADGSIDMEGTNTDLIIYNPATGKNEFVSKDRLNTVGETINPQEQLQAAFGEVDAKREAIVGNAESMADELAPETPRTEIPEQEQINFDAPIVSTSNMEVGTYVMHTKDGKEITAVVEPDEVGGYHVVSDEPLKGGQTDNYFSPDELAEYEPTLMPTDTESEKRQGTEFVAPTEKVGDMPNLSTDPIPTNTEAPAVAGETEPIVDNAPQEPTPLQRIPVNEQGKPDFESTDIDVDTAWDGLVEKMNGNEATAQRFAENMARRKQAELKQAEKAPVIDTDDPDEFAAADAERQARIDATQASLDRWNALAGTTKRREEEAAKAEQERKLEEQKQFEAAIKADREERERERERVAAEARRKAEELNGVKDWTEESPEISRERGWRRVDGERVDRQEPVDAVRGKETAVQFTKAEEPTKATFAVMEADQLQPSHVRGQRNAKTFINDAQPKERTDVASQKGANEIARGIKPNLIMGGATAYTGAPNVNSRGEVIQGNNRGAALKMMYDDYGQQAEQYKKYLMEHAEEFGMSPEQIEAMQKPVLVNMLDVDDAEAKRLGAFVSTDLETGGVERIRPEQTIQKLGGDMKSYANILLASTDDAESISEMVSRNGLKLIRWLNGKHIISDTQAQSTLDRKGNLTVEAKEDLKNVLYQSIFQGGATGLKESYDKLPAKAQRAILATGYRDIDSADDAKMVPEIQSAILAYNELANTRAFAEATNMAGARAAAKDWAGQYAIDDATGESSLPSEKYSETALQLAVMFKGMSQTGMQDMLNRTFNNIQGRTDDLFDTEDKQPMSVADAVRVTMDKEYEPIKPKQNEQSRSSNVAVNGTAGQGGQRGVYGEPGRREPLQAAERSADGRGVVDGVRGAEPHQVDRQGNPIDTNGKLVTEKVGSVDELTDEDFTSPRRSVQLSRRQAEREGEQLLVLPSDKTEEAGALPGRPQDSSSESKSTESLANTQGKDEKSAVSEGKKDDNVKRAQQQQTEAEGKMQFNGEVTEEEFNDAIDTLRDLLGAGDDDVDGLMFRDPDELSKADKVKLKMAGLTVAQAIVDNGAVSIEDFTKQMLKVTRTNKIRPWVKSFYEAMRMEPGYEDVAFTPHEDVVKFDVANYGKPTVDAMATAATVVAEQKADEASKAADADMPVADNTPKEPIAKSAKYSITPMQYTTKSKKVLDVWNVKPAEKMDTDAFRMATARAKEIDKGWYDRKSGGFLMRTEEGAKQLAGEFFGTSDDVKPAEQVNGGNVFAHMTPRDIYETTKGKYFVGDGGKEVEVSSKSKDTGLIHVRERSDHQSSHTEYLDVTEDELANIMRREKWVDANDYFYDEVKALEGRSFSKLDGSTIDIDRVADNPKRVIYRNHYGETEQKSIADFAGVTLNYIKKGKEIGKASSSKAAEESQGEEVDEPKEYTGTVILKDGRRAVIIAAMHRGEQASSYGQFTKPELYKYIGAVGRESIDIKPEDIDEELTERFRAESSLPLEERTVRFENGRVVKQEATEAASVKAHEEAEKLRKEQEGLRRLVGRTFQNDVTKDTYHYYIGEDGKVWVEHTRSDNGRVENNPETQKNWLSKAPRLTEIKTKPTKPAATEAKSDTPKLDTKSNNKDNEEVHVQPGTSTAKREGGHQRQQNGEVGTSQQYEAVRTDGGRVGGRDTGHTVSDTQRGRGVSGLSEGKKDGVKNSRNNHAERGVDYAPKSVEPRIKANIEALRLVKQLMNEDREATETEKTVLRKFSGWGGLGKAFDSPAYNGVLRELLDPEEYETATMSRNSAYYTPAEEIDALWNIARTLGFEGGKVLEGSAGIGNIIGLMPNDLSEKSDIHAVEIDGITGNILKQLYPDAKVDIKGFEQTKVRNGSVALAITNVPFVTGLRVNDETGDKDLSRKFGNIHDFCIAKNVRKLREGGLGIFITSSGTLDNSQKLRDWLVSDGNADVIGAFRLNNETFGGTGTTSDIIVVRKRVNGKKSANAIDVSTVTAERSVKSPEGKEMAMVYNKYFQEHPENMGGKMAFGFEKGSTYHGGTSAALYADDTNQGERLQAWVDSFKNFKDEGEVAPVEEKQTEVYKELGDDVKEGSMFIDDDGNLSVASYGVAVPLALNANKVKGQTKQQCFKDYTAIKEAVADVLEYQRDHDTDEGLQPLLDKLNKAYDGFVKRYGHLNKNTAISFLKNDMDFSSIAALEDVKEFNDAKGKRKAEISKTDIFKMRVVEKENTPRPKSVKDGVVTSIYLNGRVDVPYIAEQLGKSESEVKREIIESGLGFENPTNNQIEVSYEYLSGNVREKLAQAKEANENGEYDANIKALEKVQPMDIPAHLIDFSLGSSWLEPQLYLDYIKDRTDVGNFKIANAGGTWVVDAPGYGYNTAKNNAMAVRSDMLHKVVQGHELIIAAMQNKSITVSKTEKLYSGETRTTVDKDATQACATKISEIRDDFKDWAREKMKSNPELAQTIEKEYNDRFNNSVPKTIPDGFVPEYFGGASHKFKMRSHQAKAAIRATTQNLMFAHEVGSGKTFTLITTAMEMRRLGTAHKPLIVVQNATVGQFVGSAKALYPNAKILTLEDSDRTAAGRRAFYAKIKYNDWDMVVIPQSTLDMIPDSEERQANFVRDKIEEKMVTLQKMREAGVEGPEMKRAENELGKLRDELNSIGAKKAGKVDEKKEAVTKQNAEVKAKAMLDRRVDDVENFDDMGIDAILVDEAHEYKHLGFSTAMQRGVKGIDPSYSKKSQGLYLKVQAVEEKTGGKNVVFATGTPISNTAAEIWTFMRYLMPADTMKEYGIYYFDDFVRNFGSLQQMMEFATNGKFKENNRFAGYTNLPELVRIWNSVSDTVLSSDIKDLQDKIPDMEGGKAEDVYLPQTKALRSVMKYVNSELKRYEEMSGKEKKANSHIPLTMYGIAKAAAVDARLVVDDAEDDPNSKTNEAVRQTLRSLKDSEKYKGTVAIFSDTYQNKRSGFNLYEDIRNKLLEQGVPADQVVIIKSSMSVNKKLDIFNKVNAGEVRVVLGSTYTLGTGVNIQERLHTLIHVDAPNRPMDYTQRNGRILRQGNIHKELGIPVRVLRFGVEDSLDVTAYQRLKTKGAIADSIMHGKQLMDNSMENRTMEEEEDAFGDITAQLSGSEYALLKQQAEREVRKFENKRKQWESDQTYVHNQLPRLEGMTRESEKTIAANEDALKKLDSLVNGSEIEVNGEKFGSVAEMNDYLTEYNKKGKDIEERLRNSYMDESEQRKLTVNIGGLPFTIRTVYESGMARRDGSLKKVIHRNVTYSNSELGLEEVPVKGGSLKNAITDIVDNVLTGKDMHERIEAAERNIERYGKEREAVSARAGKAFEFDKELAEAKERLADYTEKMKAELEAKEAKYADMDNEVSEAKVEEPEDDDDKTFRDDDGDIFNTSDEELARRMTAIEAIKPTEITEYPATKKEAKQSYLEVGDAVNKNDGRQVTFYASAFKKIFKQDGLFQKAIPGLKNAFENSVLAFSEPDNLGGTIRPDKTEHKEHKNIVAFHHYIGKVKIGDKEYYIRYFVQEERGGSSGTHGFFVSNAEIYEKQPQRSATLPITTRGTDFNEVADAKLQQFFENARIAQDKLASAGENIRPRLIRDTQLLDFLNNQPTRKGFRYAQWANHGVLPPMTAKQNGEWRPPMVFNRWEQSEELPRKANGKVDLVQGNGRTTGNVAYNPYFHIRNGSPLNDQFTAAYDRPELIVVEGEYPESELTSGYHAEGAKDSVGLMDWHSGSVNGQLSEDTKVQTMLSRYFRPKRIVPWSEVAENIMERVGNQNIVFPINAVPPMLRAELAKRGAKFGAISGSVAEKDIPMLTDLIQRVNKGEWDAGLEKAREYEKAYESSDDAKAAAVADLSQKLHTPVILISDPEEIAKLPTYRQRRAKGWYNEITGEVVVVAANNVNVADVENTALHEIVGHNGLRELIGEDEFGRFLDEVYDHVSESVRKKVDDMLDNMIARERDRILDRKMREGNEGIMAQAEATVEAEEKREKFKRDATEEYMSDLGGRIGEEGFEKMEVEELTLWGKIKATVQKFLDKFFKGLGIPKNIKLTDKDLSYILFKSWQRKKNGGKMSAMDVAEDVVMREKTQYNMKPEFKTQDERYDYQIHTPRFKKWFGDWEKDPEHASKVVDNDGKPKVVYHGTGGWFRTYDKSRLGDSTGADSAKEGFFFTDNKNVAGHFAMFAEPFFGADANERNAEIRRRLDSVSDDVVNRELERMVEDISMYTDVDDMLDDYGFTDRRDFLADVIANKFSGHQAQVDESESMSSMLRRLGIGFDETQSVYLDIKNPLIDKTRRDYNQDMGAETGMTEVIKKAKAEGHDGVIFTDITDTWRGAQYVVFEPNQIKSATENDGGFSPDDNDTRFRDGDMGLEEFITNMKAEIASKNADDFNAKVDAMKTIGGNLQHLRSAMARQKAYDVSTVKAMGDLAQTMMNNGLLDKMSAYETKRVMSVIKNSVGKQDLSGSVKQLMDIMVNNQLHNGEEMLGNLFRLGRSHVNAKGVEVQGSLDASGQQLINMARQYTNMSKDVIDNDIIPDLLDRMGDSNRTIADNASIEYDGAQIARRYVEEITDSKAEEKLLRKSIKDAEGKHAAGTMDYDAYKQYVDATEEAITQNRIERAEAYASIAEQLGGIIGDSAERAKEWREAEQQRINDIRHNCNSDMEGRVTDEHHKEGGIQSIMNNSCTRLLLAPLCTFDQMLRMFGQKNVNGEGYLWNRFMRGWEDAAGKEYIGYRDALKELDDKVGDIFGNGTKWRDLFDMERHKPKSLVEFWDGGEKKLHELTQGNMLYIYMVNKMADGKMKLRAMGITDDDVERLTEVLDPRFIELADWMQDEFLVNRREKYNEVHKRMFGAPMAAIDNYFPLKVLKSSLETEEDISKDENAGIMMPGTATGGIIKRKRNNRPLDVTGANALNVILDHVQEMEHWAAYSELIRDINTMLSYKRFRNQVMNMTSVYGSGKTLWSNFRKTAQMAVGAYRPPVAELDKTAVNIAKGVTAAKVSFRLYTALKQFLSYPAYLPDTNVAILAKNTSTPWEAWQWSMKNLPIFEKRWKSRLAGDPRLLKTEMDWSAWRNQVVQTASRIGMSPNAFVDAVTVSIGAYSIYQTRYKKYKRWGFTDEVADKKAKQDATILFNSTQQSNEGPFLSPIQVDRSWLSTSLSVFRNSAMSYTRQGFDAKRNLAKYMFTHDFKSKTIEFTKKQLEREGLTEREALDAAREEYRKGVLHNLARVLIFDYVLPTLWNLGSVLPFLLLGSDSDEKKDMTKDAIVHGMLGSIEGLTGGDVISAAGNMLLQGEENQYGLEKNMPLVSDIMSIYKEHDGVRAANDCIGLLIQSGIGVNPQSLTDAVVAIMDYCGDDAQTSKECALLMCRIANCPQSQLDKLYFEELGVDGISASQMTPEQIARRYARYKRRRNAPLTGWMYGEEGRKSAEEKYIKKVNTAAKESLDKLTDGSDRQLLEQWRDEYKVVDKRMKAINAIDDYDEQDAALDKMEATPEWQRYDIMKSYNAEMQAISKEFLKSKSKEEQSEAVNALFQLKKEMVKELKEVQ